MDLSNMDKAAVLEMLQRDRKEYDAFKQKNLSLDMSRGKPESRQLDLSLPMLHNFGDDFMSESGVDVRNYGEFRGIIEARRLFGELLGISADNVIVGGNSSINMIHDTIARYYINGSANGDTPWSKREKVKFICPVPGYDWHFHICDTFGIEMLPVALVDNNLDMDEVERLVRDENVRGMICVPMYSNPSGATFSDETVYRLAKMQTAAKDFVIIWDNAYCVHHLYDDKRDKLLNIYDECVKCGHEDRVFMFTSTSKVTFAGSGICAMAASKKNIDFAAGLIMYQLVCYDKMNQLRHARFLQNAEAVDKHMRSHAEILRPKFELVLDVLDKELSDLNIAKWTKPLGGYFITFTGMKNTAKRIVDLCAQAGVKLTPAGAPYPHGIDPNNETIRIAPTYPPISELKQVMELFPVAVRIASAEKILEVK